MVCLAIRGFAEVDGKAALTQPGESGARGVRLLAGKFDKLVERGALRGCDGIQHTSLPVGCFWLAAIAAAATEPRARSALGRLRFTTGRRDFFWAAARLLFEMWCFMAGLQVHHRDNRGACTT